MCLDLSCWFQRLTVNGIASDNLKIAIFIQGYSITRAVAVHCQSRLPHTNDFLRLKAEDDKWACHTALPSFPSDAHSFRVTALLIKLFVLVVVDKRKHMSSRLAGIFIPGNLPKVWLKVRMFQQFLISLFGWVSEFPLLMIVVKLGFPDSAILVG
jgi:hypothetical protein